MPCTLISTDNGNKNQTAIHNIKVREAQMMINKYNSWKQNLCDIQERREEKKIIPRVSETPQFLHRAEKHWMKRVWKVEWGFLFFWFISCRSIVLGTSITHPLSFPLWNKVHCSCYKIHKNGSNRKNIRRKVLLQSWQEVTEKLKPKSTCPQTHTHT